MTILRVGPIRWIDCALLFATVINLCTLTSDVFPRSAFGSIAGIGGFASVSDRSWSEPTYQSEIGAGGIRLLVQKSVLPLKIDRSQIRQFLGPGVEIIAGWAGDHYTGRGSRLGWIRSPISLVEPAAGGPTVVDRA
jgi:hypothetical protein